MSLADLHKLIACEHEESFWALDIHSVYCSPSMGAWPHLHRAHGYPVASDGNIPVRVSLLISVKRNQVSEDLQLRLSKVTQGIVTAVSKHIQPLHKHFLQSMTLSGCGTAGSRRPISKATNKLPSSCQQDRKRITCLRAA